MACSGNEKMTKYRLCSSQWKQCEQLLLFFVFITLISYLPRVPRHPERRTKKLETTNSWPIRSEVVQLWVTGEHKVTCKKNSLNGNEPQGLSSQNFLQQAFQNMRITERIWKDYDTTRVDINWNKTNVYLWMHHILHFLFNLK